jgi:hypothetical protein
MVEIPFTDESALATLASALRERPPQVSIRGKKLQLSTAAEVDRFDGVKVFIYADEHPPPHFRVRYQGASADFRIDDCSRMTPGLERKYGKIWDWYKENRAVLIAFWNKMRPTDCPVGEFKES